MLIPSGPFISSAFRSSLPSLAVLLAGLAVLSPCPIEAQTSATKDANMKAMTAAKYGDLPLSFEANHGQTNSEVRFTSRGDGYELFLTDIEAVLSLGRKASGKPKSKKDDLETQAIRMRLNGARHGIAVAGQDQLAGTANYFIGSDPTQWHTGVPTFSKVKYTSVYEGIDLVYYGNQRQLEYDFVVAAHANPDQIQVHFDGASRLKLDADGDLEVICQLGQINFQKPMVYQPIGNTRRLVDGRFTLLAGNTVGFSVGTYNHTQPLVIDPVLVYSTFLGGSGSPLGEYAAGIAVDSTGDTYVTGTTYSSNFPVTSSPAPYLGTQPGAYSAFVSKLNAAGTALVYSTYLGGNNGSGAYSLKVDSSGNAYIAGFAFGSDFPVTEGVFQPSSKEAATNSLTGFVTKLNAAGDALVYSTFLGGSAGQDVPRALALDGSGNAYVTGYTSSATFPVTKGVFQSVSNTASDVNTGFVTKINAAATALVYSSYLGGTNGAQPLSVAVDSSGNAYVGGTTVSSNFPVTAGAYQTKNLDTTYGVGFVTKLNPAGTAETYSTYLGGSGLANAAYGDEVLGIAVDSSGEAYVAGATASVDFPITNGAYQTTEKGLETGSITGFVTRLNTTGTALSFSTYLGGSGQYATSAGASGDSAGSIAIDSSGDVFVAGGTQSSDFPVSSGAYQSTNNDTASGVGFVTELDPTGSKLLYSTYFGGTVNSTIEQDIQPGDSVYALALDAQDDVYIAGRTFSNGFPITSGAFQTTNGQLSAGGTAAFVAKLGFAATSGLAATTTSLASSVNPAGTGEEVSFTAHVVEGSTAVTTGNVVFTVDSGTGTPASLNSSGEAVYSDSALAAGTHNIKASYSGTASFAASSTTLTETVTGTPAALVSPVSGAALTSASVTFSWNQVTTATGYYLEIGSTGVGSNNIYSSAEKSQTTTSYTFTSMPTNGEKIYVRLYTNFSGTWVGNDYTYTAAGAVLISPTQGAAFTSASVTFTWNAVSNATGYYLEIGTTGVASSNLYSSAEKTPATTSYTFTRIPTNGATIYVTLYTNYSGKWIANNYTFKAAGAVLISPTQGSSFTTTSVTFTWNEVSNATGYYLEIGTTGAGSNDLYGSAEKTPSTTSYTFTKMPANGEAIYVRLNTNYSGNWIANDYTYTAAGSSITFPAAGSTFTGASVTFSWTTALGATGYYLEIGSTGVGTSNLYSSAEKSPTTTTYTFTSMPTNGETIYVRLFTNYSGTWISNDYTYTAHLQQAAAPAFSLVAGTYPSAKPVTLSDTTTGAVIYYTTNNTTPTTSSTKYTTAITISTSETIKAIAVATGYANSAVASAAYSISAASAITATPGSVAFPAATLGASDPATPVTLKNIGTTALSSLAITLTGANASSFTMTQTSGTTLAAGASCTVSAIMAPQAEGNLTAALQVTASGTSVATVGLSGFGGDPNSIAPDTYTYEISTSQGDIYVELQPGSAPNNVKNFLSYVNNGTYTNSIIHRVQQGFINQGGGYKFNGDGDVITMATTAAVAAEVKLSNLRGTLSTASAGTNTDQFFFNVGDNTSLDTEDGGYTVFAKIVGVQGVNVASDSVSLAVMDAINSDTTYTFASPFTQIPLLDYTEGAAIEPSNYVYINSITQVTPNPGGPATPVFSIGTGTYNGTQTVTMTDATPGATMYYYLFANSAETATQYTSPFTISTSQYIVGYAQAPGYSSTSYYDYEYIGID